MDTNLVAGRRSRTSSQRGSASGLALACQRKFLEFFPGGFRDPYYLESEREYKWHSHERWERSLGHV